MKWPFLILSVVSIVTALKAVLHRNVMYAVLSLLGFFVSLAALYLLLLFEFLAVAQILVYVGAVGIVLLFAVMLTRHQGGETPEGRQASGYIWGWLLAPAFFWLVIKPGIQLSSAALPKEAAIGLESLSAVSDIGRLLVGPYRLPLLGLGILLTVALIAAVAVALGEGKEEKQ